MRAFQPIARRMEAERNRNLWTPPPILRRIAWCVILGSGAYALITGFRIALYLVTVQNSPSYELTHKWPGSPLQIVALMAVFLCIPFVTSRGPKPKKKHVPDPGLSIRPR
jgi:TRAP-type C4-dicarboxylate transport system permease small subunit